MENGKQDICKLEIENCQIENGKLKMGVVIPPNTTASVVLEKAKRDSLQEGGQAIQGGNGILNIQSNEVGVQIEIGSGAYFFEYEVQPCS